MDGEGQKPNLEVIQGGKQGEGIYIKPRTGLPAENTLQTVRETPEGLYVKPTTGLPEGHIGGVIENQSLFARARRALGKFLDKHDTWKPGDKPPFGKAF